MDWSLARSRFAFVASALEGSGGFRPRVTWQQTWVTDPSTGHIVSGANVPTLAGPTELVRHRRESDANFGARNALAVYENHLRGACERFAGFLGRRSPQRDNADAPLVALMVNDADLRGSSLDAFWRSFALDAKARGSLLLVIDVPEGAPATSLGDQLGRRRVPYIRSAFPENLLDFRTDPDSGLFLNVTLASEEWIDDKLQAVERDYTTTGWRIRIGDRVIREGEHAFGACPVLAFTESSREFPVIGEYEQIACLSRAVFNKRSERDDLMRSQGFSLLTLQVPPDSNFDPNTVSATIGTHSMLVHAGDTPAFISPDSGPAERYSADIEELQQAIRRIGREESTEVGTQAESGVARRLRFEALNASIATFAQNLQQLELRMWALFHRAIGSTSRVSVAWPTDYNLSDVAAELDILTMMQAAGFPPRVLTEKRQAIASAEFDSADDDTKAELAAAIDEAEQAAALDTPDPNNPDHGA